MMKKTIVMMTLAFRACAPELGSAMPAGGTVLTSYSPSGDAAAPRSVSHPLRNHCRLSRRRRSNETVLHEELRFLARPTDEFEGPVIQRIAGLCLPRDSLFHRLEGHRGRLPGKHVDLIHRGDDVRLVEALFLRDLREFLRSRDAHLIGDRPCTHVQRATENPWETQRVVHLVREVGPACGNDTGSGLRRLPWPDLRHGIRNHKENRIVRHRGDPILLDYPGSRLRCGDCDVRVSHRLRDATLPIASIRFERELPLLRVLVGSHLNVLSMTTDDPLRIDEDDVLRLRTRGDQELRGPDVRRPGTDERDCDVRHPLAHDFQGVDETGYVDCRGPLLIVVPHGD